MSATIPHLPVGFSSWTSDGERTLSHPWNRQFGAVWACGTVLAGAMSVVENGRESAPLALVLGALSLAFLALPLLVNTTHFTFRRGSFTIAIRPLRLRRDRVFALTDIANFAHRRPKDGERIDLVMDLASGESVTLHEGVVDENAAHRLCEWLQGSRTRFIQ